MVRYRPTLSVLALVLSVAALIACGGSTETASNEAAPPSVPPAAETTEAHESEPRNRTAPAATVRGKKLGAALADPARYYGVYATADSPDRQWFVAEAKRSKYAEQAPEVPPGHLALGAMFGDVAPYHLKTLSETEFEQAWVSEHQEDPVAIEFELDDRGRAVAMRFTDGQGAPSGRHERQGDLPTDWE